MSPGAGHGGSRARHATSTTNFGSGRRESHDATAFYGRFTPPEVSDDTTIGHTSQLDVIHATDARDMTQVASNSVALVATSPPYFAGKQYEQDLAADSIPSTYLEYLQLLRDVFAECKRVLEPGGRIAVNVANLGRRPYRSLAGDVTAILGDLGLLLRGEVVWWKGRAAGGSCAWGTFQRPANPVLRDVTERIVIASKGRFDRAIDPKHRAEAGLPSTATIAREEFMEATTDLWEIAPESAHRVGHPAPFPVALPQRLIDLYTYAGDVVLDPFMGSGSTAVAAVRTGRRYIGFDLDPDYVTLADERIRAERALIDVGDGRAGEQIASHVELPAVGADASIKDPVAEGIRQGHQVRDIARLVVESCGFTNFRTDVKPRGLGVVLSLVAADQRGNDWVFDVTGAFTTTPAGLRRTDTLWKSLATAAVFHEAIGQGTTPSMPLVFLTTDLPSRSSAGDKALRIMTGPGGPVTDVIELLSTIDRGRLTRLAQDGPPPPTT